MKTTQNQTILEHLLTLGPITSREAIRGYGITRLAARIYDLRRDGVVIEERNKRVMTRTGTTTVAEYYLGEI